jgi:hypothetical protein
MVTTTHALAAQAGARIWRRRGAGGGTVKSGQHDLVVISSAMAGLQVSMTAG